MEIPKDIASQLPPAVREMLVLINSSREELEETQFKGRDLWRFDDIDPDRKPAKEMVGDKETGRLFYFLKNKLLYISHTNGEGQVDSLPNSFTRLHQLMGKADFSLRSRGGRWVRQFVYLDYGLTLIGDEDDGRLVEVVVFKPMSKEKYKHLVWDPPPPPGVIPDL
jgi:hypothetical protein